MKSILTVVDPASSYDLTTLQTVKSELDITGPNEDDKLRRSITSISKAVATYCQRVFAQEDVSEQFRLRQPLLVHGNMTFHSRHHHPLKLRRYPVSVIASVSENGTLLDPSNYELDGENGTLARLNNDRQTVWTASKIIIAYTAGWILPPATGRTLPEDVENAVIQMVQAARATRKRDPTVSAKTIFGISQTVYRPTDEGGGQIDPSMFPAIDLYVDRRIT